MGAGQTRGLLMALTYLTYTPRGTKKCGGVIVKPRCSTLRADLKIFWGLLGRLPQH